MDRIPLFPLGTVLLPGSQLPMRLFEPRYLRLLADLMALPEADRRFGVVAIRRGHEVGADQAGELFEVGCEGLVSNVVPAPIDNRMVFNLLLTGSRRFRVAGLVSDSDKPYAVADVEWLDDPTVPLGPDTLRVANPQAGGSDPDAAHERELRAAHREYLQALQATPVDLTGDSALLAYDAADRSLLGLQEKQRLIEEPDAPSRNVLLAGMLRRETELIGRFHAVPHQQPPGGASLN